jgi:serine/threonine protein kinase
MYEMLVGENPFKITKEEELVKIVKEDIRIPAYVEVGSEATSLLLACLQKNPKERPNIRELLNH